MSAPSKAISTTIAVTASEVHLSSSEYYSVITVENGTGQPLNVTTDGSTATAGAGTHMETVPAGGIASFGNMQSLPNANTTPGTDQSLSTGWTAQKGYVGTSLTFCSVIPQSTTSGDVTISFE